MSQEPPPNLRATKYEALNAFLEHGRTMIYVNALHRRVDVPPAYKNNPNLRLDLSRRFPRPMQVSESGVTAQLSFGGVAHKCVIPWDALFGMFNHVTHQELLWPEDIPPQLLEGLSVKPRDAAPEAPPRRAVPKLAAVPDPEPLTDEPEAAAPQPEAAPPKRPALRLVK